MSFVLPCPHCGPRPVDEFAYSGEVTRRPGLADAARAHRLRVLPRQPGRAAARMVAASARLRRVVSRRARHAHERGDLGVPSRAERPEGRRVRLPPQPGELIDRDETLRFRLGEYELEGFGGDTIGSALYARGRRVFSRSFKYHRPRGLLCCSGHCPNCMMTVDGVPNVRVCVEPLRDGAVVTPQNVFGRLDMDFMRVVDKVGGPFTPVGFYYRTMIRPRFVWPLLTSGSCGASPASGGSTSTPATRAATTWSTGGRACSSSAVGRPGGPRRWRRRPRARRGRSSTRRLPARRGPPRCRGSRSCERTRDLGGEPRPRRRRKRPLPLPGGANHRRDGRSRAAARLPGERPRRRDAARGVRRLGGTSPSGPGTERWSWPRTSAASSRPTSSRGRCRGPAWSIFASERPRARGGGSPRPGAHVVVDGEAVDCDLVVVSGGRQPAYALLAQAGARVEYDDARGVRPDGAPPGVEAVGSVTGEGIERSTSAAYEGHGKCFVCICEDVTTKDVKRAIGEGFDSIELAKRYTTVTMGPCQGKLCQLPRSACMRRAACDESAIGTTTARPPWAPVELGLLAGRHLEPPPHLAPLPPRGAGRQDDVGRAVEAPVRVRRQARGRGPRGSRRSA